MILLTHILDKQLEMISNNLVILFFFFLGTPHGLWDLNPLNRDQTHAPTMKIWNLNHRTAREVPT